MATRFVRIDLSETARDYRPIAVEPGVPMLDRNSANSRIIYRWIGGIAAEPVWDGDFVGFYVRDDQGGRLEDIVCQPASCQDLRTQLKDDLEKLRERLDRAKAETPTERLTKKILLQSFKELTDNPNRSDLDSYFFRYRDVHGNWRLVWCWGYQRIDNEPAPAVVCTDPDCNLLFVRRPGKSPRCPSCAGMLAARPKQKTNWKLTALAALLLLLLLGGAGWWALRPGRLVAMPATLSGPVGASFQAQVLQKGLLRKKDRTHEAIGISYDPRVARYNQTTGRITLLSPGTTKIEFQVGEMKTDVAVAALPSANPEKISIDPPAATLAVGTTARLKLIGEYKDGAKVDLTEVAEWTPQNDAKVFAYKGLIEGVAPGASTVAARYRANAASPYVEAAANVQVDKADFKAIEVGVDPATVDVGLGGKLRADVVAANGTKYSVLESSQLRTNVNPPALAAVNGSYITGQRAGAGKLTANFGTLAGETDLKVVSPTPFTAEVRPENLDLVVDEISDIAFVSNERGPVVLTSAKPDIAEITAANRVIGRAVGQTQIIVTQNGRTLGTVNVGVTKADFQSLAIDPGSVAVAVDDVARPRILAEIKGIDPPRTAEIAPDLVTAAKKPSPIYADLNSRIMELRGISATNPSNPQTLEVAFSGQRASAPVEVVFAPCRFEITPYGPINLPLGQLMRLQGFAEYSGGRRVLVPSERIKWESEEKNVAGLKLYNKEYTGAVGATKAGVGPLTVFGTYVNEPSNRVVFKSVDVDPNVKLAIEIDRTLRLAGEQGQALLTASGPTGDVELVPDLAVFKTSDPKVLQITVPRSGRLAGVSPGGEATVTATHMAAKDPASLKFHVYEPAKAKILFDPAIAKVAVDEQAKLQLYLEAQGKDGKTERAPMVGAGVAYSITNPSAIRWEAPIVTGLSPEKPFPIRAAYFPALNQSASAQVEVIPSEKADIRITPSSATAAPGQTVSLAVEAKSGDQWKEVRPDAVSWKVPVDVDWSPATEQLRGALRIPADAKADVTVSAEVEGKSASVTIGVKAPTLDAKDPDARLVLDREPSGEYLPANTGQRYEIRVEKGNISELAADVHWPENFENEFVKWEAPVLTAKKQGTTQWLRAEAGGRTVLWHTTTIPQQEPDLSGGTTTIQETRDIPDSVKILSDQGPLIRFPVGATFDDFRVEAHYPDGYTRLVTKKAILSMPEPPGSAYLTDSFGKLIGVRPGSTEISAEFDTVKSKVPLKAEVLGSVEIDKLVIDPDPVVIRPGETIGLKAIGMKAGKSIGDITGLGTLTWKSTKPEVAKIDGPALYGASLGQATVTVQRGETTSAPTPVEVTNSTGSLTIDPKSITMHEGESLRIGSDIHVLRKDMDVSELCNVTPESPGIVTYVPDLKILRAEHEGHVPIGISVGDQVKRVEVTVLPGIVQAGGTLSLEPAMILLAPGQREPLAAKISAVNGDDVDRTSSAAFQSTDPKVATIDTEGRVCAHAPGTAQIIGVVGGLKAKATLEVKDEQITDLSVRPEKLSMAQGDRSFLQIVGNAPTSGAKELFPQPDLKVSAGKPNVIEINNGEQVHALGTGDDAIDISWKDKLKKQVPVNVSNANLTDLRIDPPDTTISTTQAITYGVSGMRGGQRVDLTPLDGVKLFVTDAGTADVADGFTVSGKSPGTTTVVAQVGDQKAQTSLNVVAGGAVAQPGGAVVGLLDGTDTLYRGNGTTTIIDSGDVTAITPTGKVVGLVFEPDNYMSIPAAEPQIAKVFEQLDGGQKGREVTNDPALKVTDPNADVATMEKNADGLHIHPKGPGKTFVKATLGDQSATMLIQINGDEAVKNGQLIATPNPLELWSGETTNLGSVRLDLGGGEPPIPVEYKATPAEGQGIISVGDDNKVSGKSVGETEITVTATDPKLAGLSTKIKVQVTAAEALTIDPAEITLEAGQSTPLISVKAHSADGQDVAVPAMIVSGDENVLSSDPANPGAFIAKSQGQTQLHATYRGKEVVASVSVTGKRFESVTPNLEEIANDKDKFAVSIEVLAAEAEGELEYRVYTEGAAPQENWVPNKPDTGGRKATLRTDPMDYGPRGKDYHLILEARDKTDKNVQKYPLTFKLGATIHVKTDSVKDSNKVDSVDSKDTKQPKDSK